MRLIAIVALALSFGCGDDPRVRCVPATGRGSAICTEEGLSATCEVECTPTGAVLTPALCEDGEITGMGVGGVDCPVITCVDSEEETARCAAE